MELDKKKNEIWNDLEKEYGFPLSQLFRDRVDSEIGTHDNYDGDPLGLEGYLEDYLAIATNHVESAKLASISFKGDKQVSKPKRIYRKPFERRVYLVNFVLSSSSHQGGGTWRHDWKRITAEWNESHPSDLMGDAVLKVEYYRAIRDVNILAQFVIIYTPSGTQDEPYTGREHTHVELMEAWRKFQATHSERPLAILYWNGEKFQL